MDTFTIIVAAATFFFTYLGENFKKGAYLWIAALLSILLALRMSEAIFYMITAGIIAILIYRTFDSSTDVRIDDVSEQDDD